MIGWRSAQLIGVGDSMSLDDLAIEYRGELPTAQEFERLFRSSGWTEAFTVPADRLEAALPSAWYAVCARRGGEAVGTGIVLSDGVLHALIVDVIVMPEMRGHGIGTEIMRRLDARCQEAGVPVSSSSAPAASVTSTNDWASWPAPTMGPAWS
jgi:GNAT superfamily N-acetyltransferase